MTDEPKWIEYWVEPSSSGFEVVCADSLVDGDYVVNQSLVSEELAYQVAYLLAFNERERLGWPPGDPRIQFPDRPEAA